MPTVSRVIRTVPMAITARQPVPDAPALSPPTLTIEPVDVYVGPTLNPLDRARERPFTKNQSTDLGWRYRLEQYGTDALVFSGATLAFTLLVAPEPFVTKIVGGIIALVCILGGLAAKHHLFKQAYAARALEHSVGRLGTRIDQLTVNIASLESTRHSLESTNHSLEQNRVRFEGDVSQLKNQVTRLELDVNDAFRELNKDRNVFESEKKIKLAHLNDEILESGTRKHEVDKRLAALDVREEKLAGLSAELNDRRQKLVDAEAKLQQMQASILRQMTGR